MILHYLKKGGESSLGSITDEERLRAAAFLKKIRGVLSTSGFTVMQYFKNKEFDRKYPLRDQARKEILLSLTADDCRAIGPNENSRYPEAEVYQFIKRCRLNVYGEETDVNLYIKTYLREEKTRDLVIVISFHEEGMF